MPEPSDTPKPEKPLGARKPSRSPSSESELWDLDDDESIMPAIIESGLESSPPEPVARPTPAESPEAATPPAKASSAPEKPAEVSGEQSPRTPGGMSAMEKFSLGGLGLLLLAGAIWALTLFFREIPTESPQSAVQFPAKGTFTTIAKINTYWRQPDHAVDVGVRQESRLIPAAVIALGEGSDTGALRILFEDESGIIVGDPVTLAVNGGKFAEGNTEREVHATVGFKDEGEHAAYLTDQIGRWHMLVKEGPDPNASGSEFTDLVRVPISVSRQ